MSFYPFNPNLASAGQQQSDVAGVLTLRAFPAHYKVLAAAAVAADTDGVLAAVTDTGSQQVITTGITNPAVPRNVTATAGGTAGDIKAIQVIIAGTDYDGNAISETLPAFTVNTAGSVVGSKAFKTITSITIPAHDGTGATTEIGWGDKLGLPDKLTDNTVLFAFLNHVREGTAPTVAVSSSAISGNTVNLNSALDGTQVDVYYLV